MPALSTKLLPATILERAPEVSVRVSAHESVRIAIDGVERAVDPHALALLAAFERPRALGDVIAELGAHRHGARDWIDLTATAYQLVEAGVLRRLDEPQGALRLRGRGFDAPSLQLAMLDDHARTSAFLAAIAETVSPGDVVLDLGTGSGILAVAAARAGARRVYAVEAGDIGRVAQAVFESNGVADRVTLLRGWSTRLDLPERANVLVTETLGHEPLAEGFLETVLDARRRHLADNARIVPACISVVAVAVELSSEDRRRLVLDAAAVNEWTALYGIDLTPLATAARFSAGESVLMSPAQLRTVRMLSPPTVVATLRTAGLTSPTVELTSICEVTAQGRLDALVTFFDLELARNRSLSTSFLSASRGSHWKHPVRVLADGPLVRPGDRFEASYRYGGGDAALSVRVLP